jgi:hypothetical protein
MVRASAPERTTAVLAPAVEATAGAPPGAEPPNNATPNAADAQATPMTIFRLRIAITSISV